MRFITAILLLISLNACTQESFLGFNKGKINTTAPVLIIFTGESNSGGLAPNSGGTPTELGSRSGVKILNNRSIVFENLNIGAHNNLIGHAGLEDYDSSSHGWELELANRVASGDMPNPTYLVKTGQGGSIIGNWGIGGIYGGIYPWDTMMFRVDTSIALIRAATGRRPKLFIFYSQGINDMVASTNVSVWKAATKAHIQKIRDKWGERVPFFMTNFYQGGYTTYNTAIAEICSEMTEVYLIDTNGANNDGVYHWLFSGMNLVADRLIDSLRYNY